MGILAWTLGPSAAATALAMIWIRVANRERGPVEIHDSLAAHERFKVAMEKPQPTRKR